MPICITCSTPVKNLYTTYSKADDRSLGKGVRLTQCPKCKRFADKYVEHDYVVLFIDLVLIKPQVYRHLLFNRLGRTDDKFDPSILRLGTLLVLFDVYITWARIEKSNDSISTSPRLSNAPIVTQYLFFLTLNIIATVAQHLTIRFLVQAIAKYTSLSRKNHQKSVAFNHQFEQQKQQNRDTSPSSSRSSPVKAHSSHQSQNQGQNGQPTTVFGADDASTSPVRINPSALTASTAEQQSSLSTSSSQSTLGPGHASPSAISTALLVSSCTKLFPILLVIWPTSSGSNGITEGDADNIDALSSSTSSSSSIASFAHRASSYIGWIVLLNNIEALQILLDCGYLIAGVVAVAGVVSRWFVEGWLLSLAGILRDGGGFSDGPISDVLGMWNWVVRKM